jgi:hypothetical protein
MLTAQAWIVVAVFLMLIGVIVSFLFTRHIYSFLAINAPIASGILVVEGWMPDYAIEAVASQFNQGCYQRIVTLGFPLQHGYFLSDYKTFANLAAATLIALGISADRLIPISLPHTQQDRTLVSAIALRDWLLTQNLEHQSIDLVTLGPHARRSWLTFKAVLSPAIQVGIIAVRPLDYQPERWWQFSAGARTVISEAIGYLYARWR